MWCRCLRAAPCPTTRSGRRRRQAASRPRRAKSPDTDTASDGAGHYANVLACAPAKEALMGARTKRTVGLAIVFGAGLLAGNLLQPASVLRAQGGKRVFELRTYTTPEGKLPALQARFRDHTRRIFD